MRFGRFKWGSECKLHSAEEFQKVLGEAKRYAEHLIEAIPEDTPKTDLTARLRPALELVAHCSPIEQDAYVDLITRRFKLRRGAVNKLLREHQPPKPVGKGESKEAASKKARGDTL